MLSLITVLSAFLVGTTMSALSQAEANGPSGYVVYPPGGTSFSNPGGATENNGAGGVGFIHIQYQGVLTGPGTYPEAETVGIDIYLEDPTGAQSDQYMAYDFGNPNDTVTLIDGYFSPPSGACGTYNLVFVEHQAYENTGNIIKFRAASPSITITCPNNVS